MRLFRIVLIAGVWTFGVTPLFAGPKPPAPPAHAQIPTATGSHPTVTPRATHVESHTTTVTHGSPKATAPVQGPSSTSPPRSTSKPVVSAHSARRETTVHGETHVTHAGASAVTTPGDKRKTAALAAPTASSGTAAAPLPNPIAQKILSNHGLQPKVSSLLPTGMTLDQASLGFRNQGQFIAALHVSRNLGIPFADLKAAMTGIRPGTSATSGGPTSGTTTTAPATMSLGQAIQKLRPSTNAPAATTTAEHEASEDLRAHVTTATTTATTASTKSKKHHYR